MLQVTEMPREAGRYSRKRRPVRAVQFHTPFEFLRGDSRLEGKSGDYLVLEEGGVFLVMDANRFNQTYEVYQ